MQLRGQLLGEAQPLLVVLQAPVGMDPRLDAELGRAGGDDPYGEQQMVTALIFAHGRWGSGTGPVNYEAGALALLDVLLPGPAEGLSLVLTLHRLGLPVVVLTTAASLREQAHDSGAAAFLEKDHNLHLIPRALRAASHPPER